MDNNSSGSHALSSLYKNLCNEARTKVFEQLFEQCANGKRILHAGAGSGLFALLAAKHGAQKVFALETNPEIARICSENILRNNLQGKITLVNKDIRELKLNHFADVKFDLVIVDNFSIWQVSSSQTSLMNHINNFLVNKEAIYIPSAVHNYLELSQAQFEFGNLVQLRTHYTEAANLPACKLLSEATLANVTNLNEFTPESNNLTIQVKANKNGLVNSIRLSSPIIFLDENNPKHLLDPIIFPLPKDIYVSEGDLVEHSIRFATNTNWEEFKCSAKVLS